MAIITVNNSNDVAVAGETNLRQAIAEAQNGDTIKFENVGRKHAEFSA